MDREFGFAFDYPQSWDVQVEGNGNTTVKNLGDDNQGTITVQKISNRKITNTDSMIGSVTYFFDTVTSSWMVTDSRDNPATGEKGPRTFEALPQDSTSTGLPIFLGTGRWKTVIIPLAEEKFLLINIIGDKDTTPLTPLSHTVRKI
jgi:hypothetical protein